MKLPINPLIPDPSALEPVVQGWVAQQLGESGIAASGRLGGGLWLGALDQPPQAGCLHLEGSIRQSTAVGVILSRSSAQSIPNAAATPVAWDTAFYDPEGLWDAAAPGRVTLHQSGIYLLIGALIWDPNASGVRLASFRLNAAAQSGGGQIAGVAGSYNRQSTAGLLALAEGDQVELTAYQNSGASLNLAVVAGWTAPLLGVVRVA